MSTEQTLDASPHGSDPEILLGVLSAVELDAKVTQRKLSSDLGIALGLANSYLKRCVRKGWVKVGQVPMRRYAYYLTPQGFSEKARLTTEYLTWSFEFFRKSRLEITHLLTAARERNLTKFLLVGAGELAELAVLSAIEAEVQIVGILDPFSEQQRCAGCPVFAAVDMAVAYFDREKIKLDAVLVTSMRDTDQAVILIDAIVSRFKIPLRRDRILLPKVLKTVWPSTLVWEDVP